GTVDLAQHAWLGVVGEKRLRLLAIDLEARPDDLLAVVGALIEGTAAAVADAWPRRGLEDLVEHRAARAASPPPREPSDHLVRRHVETHHLRAAIGGRDDLLEAGGLRQRAREPVE